MKPLQRRAGLIVCIVLLGLVAPTMMPGGEEPSETPLRGTARRTVELTIGEAVSAARRHSFSLQSAEHRAELARERARLAKRALLPTLSLSYGRSETVSYGAADLRERTLGMELRAPLYLGGSVSAAVAAERRRAEEALRAGQQAVEELSYETTTRYIQLLLARTTLEIQRELLGVLERELHITRRAYGLGEITAFDAVTVELEYASALGELEQATENLRRTELSLALLMGLERPETLRLEPQERLDLGYRGSTSLSYDRRHLSALVGELGAEAQLQAELSAAFDAYRLARRAGWPRVHARIGVDAEHVPHGIREPGLRVGLEFSAALPLMPVAGSLQTLRNGEHTRTRTASAQAEPMNNLDAFASRKAALLELQIVQNAVEAARRMNHHEVVALDITREHAVTRAELASDRAELHRRSARISAARHELGIATHAEYLRAEIAAAQAQAEAAQTVSSLFLQELALLRTVGLPVEHLSAAVFTTESDSKQTKRVPLP